jgi:hypothetical protein
MFNVRSVLNAYFPPESRFAGCRRKERIIQDAELAYK